MSVVSDSSRLQGLQPTRLLHPWDSPGKSTGVGCHCLLPMLEQSLKIGHGESVMVFPGGSDGKGSACSAGDTGDTGDMGSIPG